MTVGKASGIRNNMVLYFSQQQKWPLFLIILFLGKLFLRICICENLFRKKLVAPLKEINKAL